MTPSVNSLMPKALPRGTTWPGASPLGAAEVVAW